MHYSYNNSSSYDSYVIKDMDYLLSYPSSSALPPALQRRLVNKSYTTVGTKLLCCCYFAKNEPICCAPLYYNSTFLTPAIGKCEF